MPDLGPAFGALLDFGPVIGAALKALLKTVFGMVLLGAVVTAFTVYFAARGLVGAALIAAVLSLVALAVVTGILAVKNAVMRGLLHGLKKLQLGTRVLTLLFNQIGVTERSTQGERAGRGGPGRREAAAARSRGEAVGTRCSRCSPSAPARRACARGWRGS